MKSYEIEYWGQARQRRTSPDAQGATVTPVSLYQKPLVRKENNHSVYSLCVCGREKKASSKQCICCRYDKGRDIQQPHDPLIKHIPLTKGQFSVIDAKHYDRVCGYRYYALWSPGTQSYYAARAYPLPEGKQGITFLHRDILGLSVDDPITVDHIETAQTLNNREMNLRTADRSEQKINQRKYKNNTSGYKGVWLDHGKWRAAIGINRKRIQLGAFDTPELAYAAYCKAAKELHGDFARLT